MRLQLSFIKAYIALLFLLYFLQQECFMYAYISGKVANCSPTSVVIETYGVGYDIRISLQTFSKIKDNKECLLFTWLHVQENAHTLFGFASEEEKRLFLLLVSVSGIGPTTAITMLSSALPYDIQEAIANENVKKLQAMKGIGPKTAQRVILELKDKIRKIGAVSSENKQYTAPQPSIREQALEALLVLGLARPMAEKGLEEGIKQLGSQASVESLIRFALNSNPR
jgi:holliday junction DNA helicase RuvA